MKGIVNTDLNERLQPSVNAKISRFYQIGDIINIVDAVLGDPYDGDDLWFQLDSGAYVWNAAVNLQQDYSLLSPEDKEQYLISYREILGDGRPDMASKDTPESLYFIPLRLPAVEESIRVNHLVPEFFADCVVKSVMNLENSRKHVVLYIHGFQLSSSLKLDLLNHFVRNYMTHPNNSIAKVLFMVWPAQSLGRKTIDDRSVKAGQRFTKNNLFEGFVALSKKLKEKGKCLDLIVHSFGHQLLNGMLNPTPDFFPNIPTDLFENVFLMAPDVTHQSVNPAGIKLFNYFKDSGGEDFQYDFSRLLTMSNNVYVFHNRYDYLLHSSTKRFVGAGNLKNPASNAGISKNYLSLGNFGSKQVDPGPVDPRFHFIDVQHLVQNELPTDLTNFPFRNLDKTSSGKKIDMVLERSDYGGINLGRIVTHIGLFSNHHRYLFTSSAVVNKVISLLA